MTSGTIGMYNQHQRLRETVVATILRFYHDIVVASTHKWEVGRFKKIHSSNPAN